MVFFVFVGGSPWALLFSVVATLGSVLLSRTGLWETRPDLSWLEHMDSLHSDSPAAETYVHHLSPQERRGGRRSRRTAAGRQEERDSWAFEEQDGSRDGARSRRGARRDAFGGPGGEAGGTGTAESAPPGDWTYYLRIVSCTVMISVYGLALVGALLMSRPELATGRITGSILRLNLRLRDTVQRFWHHLLLYAGDDAVGVERRRTQATSDQLSKLPVEIFTSADELSQWSPSRLRDELRKLQRVADMQLGRFTGGLQARETHRLLRAGGSCEKRELVEAILKAKGGDSGVSCAVCLSMYDPGDRLRILPCGHRFHCDCVDKWLLQQSCTCPLCSKSL